ncbi:MAG: ABC transporter permease [Betaproteobacteria bacterium]|nr:MAG: ABC transporter permease [Betaproteobacteria bacterium]
MRTWLRHHRQAVALALGKLLAQKAAALLNALVIGVALALPAGGYALLANLLAVTQRFAPEAQLSLFLRTEATKADADAIADRLKADARVATTRFVSRDAALKSLRATEGLAEVVAALGKNPLPDAFVVHARDPSPEALDALARDLRGLGGVAHVQVDSAWARRLAAIAATGRIATGVLAALLAVGLIAVTFNTIRLQILTHAEEITVSRLIGATDGYIARPFYYFGSLQGVAGGVVALAIVWLGLAALNLGVQDLADSFGSTFRLAFPGAADASSLVGFAGLLGWLGSYLSVSVHLRKIS